MTTGLLPEIGLNIVNLYAPAGTRIPMQQAAPPLGWTSDTSAAFNDCSMRINSGSGGSSGGSTAWSQWNFGGSFNVNTFAIAVSQLPPHNHGINDPTHSHVDPGHQHIQNSATYYNTGGSTFVGGGGGNIASLGGIGTGTTSVSLNNAATGISTQNTGSGSTITPTYTTPQVKYADHIIAVKS